MAEDRGMEKYGKLQSLIESDNIYNNFMGMCKEADEKYNSGLFHFKESKNRNTSPDELTPTLNIDDGVYKTIIKGLYYPDSPYEFSVLSPEILGNVYEQFLGKVIRLTPSHMAKVEEKLDVKKAGGIFYTPQNIVYYIIENTVGMVCKGSTPTKVSKIRILDPACGSGSFLLGAYTYLLKWHLDYYLKLKNKKRWMYKGKNGEWHLTIQEKKRILQDNIYGVDIDLQAVEVTKLSLLLKVLEGENKDALEAQQKFEKALPDLDNNIKCGNSLIGHEIYNDYGLNSEDILKINPFDWEKEFNKIIKNGGFDVVVGNPPYVRQEKIKEIKPYLKDHYSTYTGIADLYVYFFEKSINLLKNGGFFSFICSDKFLRANYGKNLRKFILKNKFLRYTNYAGEKVFDGATVDPCITVIKKEDPIENKIVVNDKFEVEQNRFNEEGWSFESPETLDIKDKINAKGVKLKDIPDLNIYYGIKTGYNNAFFIDTTVKNKLIDDDPKSENFIKPLVRGRDLKRWEINYQDRYLLYVPWKFPIDEYPSIKKHLLKFKDKLQSRPEVKSGRFPWFALSRYASDYNQEFEKPKLIYPDIASSLFAVFDEKKLYTNDRCFIITMDNDNEKYLEYLSVLLSSNVLNFIFRLSGALLGKSGVKLAKIHVGQLPIFPTTLKEQIPLIEIAEMILQLHKDLKSARTPQNKKLIERQIDAADKQIDKLVYDLYGLTENEINIIEKQYNYGVKK